MADRLSPATSRIMEVALREALSQGRREVEPVDVLRAFHRNVSEVDCARIGEAVVGAFVRGLAASPSLSKRRP